MKNRLKALGILLLGLLGVALVATVTLFIIEIGGPYVVATLLILPFLIIMYNFILDDLNGKDKLNKRYNKTK